MIDFDDDLLKLSVWCENVTQFRMKSCEDERNSFSMHLPGLVKQRDCPNFEESARGENVICTFCGFNSRQPAILLSGRDHNYEPYQPH